MAEQTNAANEPINYRWLTPRSVDAYYSVSYFDTLEGGSGLTRVKACDLHKWLKTHPGYLIRNLSPDWLEV